MANERWETHTLQHLSEADVVVCQLTPALLDSTFCELNELQIAINHKATLVAYILKDCDWKNISALNRFQILPRDARPLVAWADEDNYWRNVAEGIQEAVRIRQNPRLDGNSRTSGSASTRITRGDQPSVGGAHQVVRTLVVPSLPPSSGQPLGTQTSSFSSPSGSPESGQSTLAPLKLFLSYAHQDERYIKELRKDLKLMERNGLIATWYDHALIAGEKWEERILQELENADAIACQLSRDFLASEFCALTELRTAIKRKSEGKAELIAYVLKACGWREVSELRKFQILPQSRKGPVPISAWRDSSEYWRAVAEGIKEALKKLQRAKQERNSVALELKIRSATAGEITSDS
jgi:hypothetical protein